MTIDKSESGSDTPEPTESLSATGMFLRAFGESPKVDPSSAHPLKASPAEVPAQPGVQRPVASTSAAGEFTQLFHTLESRPAGNPAPPVSGETSIRPATPAVRIASQVASEQASDRAPGEFTRIFVGGVNPQASSSPKSSEELTRQAPLPAASPARAKGFSSPGVSGSASGEGSFTQLFNTPSQSPNRPAPEPPVQSAPRNSAWNNDPIFRTPQNPPPSEPPSPSVTTLLASLGSSGGGSSPLGRPPDPAPYRPEPSFRTPPPVSPEPSQVASGGVTRLIQRLAQTPAEPAPASPPMPTTPPVSSGPGEFTRMISRMGPSSPAAEPPTGAPPAVAAPAPAPFAAPAMPAIAPPPIPQAPKFAPAPAPAMPPAPMPAVPKPPALAVPALAAPKSKLEAMVPILLVINTFLLLILLIVVIFLIKSR